MRPSRIFDQHAIAIQENGGADCRGGDVGLRRRQIGWNAYIKEGTIIERAAQQHEIRKARKDVGFEGNDAGRDMLQHIAVHQLDATIGRPTSSGRARGEALDTAIVTHLDRAVAPNRRLAPQRERGQRTVGMQRDIKQVYIEAGIAVQQQEALFQIRAGQPQATRYTQGSGSTSTSIRTPPMTRPP